MKPSITTYTARSVNPLEINPSDVCLEDVAHHLACINRFVGAVPIPISVAQHSVYVSRVVEVFWQHRGATDAEILAAAKQGLFHDGSEAYLGDVSKWVKADPSMKFYREAEHRAQIAIYEAFGCLWTKHPELERADRLMVRFEAWQAWGDRCDMWKRPTHPRPTPEEMKIVGKWQPWSWKASREAFLTRYRELYNLRSEIASDDHAAARRTPAAG